ncbi:MAG: hypothetical protein IT347_14550 [Candidatus Eisenbacteria bacterium]|nr:hypothetical protein [Candidatus Eisenbacteria bacterium]
MIRGGRSARRSRGAPGSRPAPPAAGGPALETPLAALVAALALAWRYRDAFRLPFLNDDYVFLDATAHRPFASLWGFDRLFFHWWRPWSREWHYWLLQRLGGPSEPLFHLANLLLAFLALALFHDLARSLLGRARAAFALAAAAAMSAWALPLLWSAGSQDLWMIVWSLAALAAWRRGRRAPAFAAYALALASKETAAPLPLLFVAWDAWIARRDPVVAFARALPAALIAVPWALAHPHLGGRWLRHVEIGPVPASLQLSGPLALGRSALALTSADARLAPEGGWGAALLGALPAALLLSGLVLAAAVFADRREAARRGALPFGLAWCACGWLPLLLPGLGWHAYYGLFGALGAWLAIATLVRPDALAVAAIAVFSFAASARDATPSADWGDASYQRRAGALLGTLRGRLLAIAPHPEPHTRFWFVSLPNNIGFLQGDGPALRTWYGDPTLRAGFFSAWRPAPEGAPGKDRFFKWREGAGWTELVPGPENAAAAMAANPLWGADHMALARTFADAGAWKEAAREFEKVATALPRDAEPAYNAAVSRASLGDSLAMARWLAEARRRPVVSERLRAAAREAGLTYW